jgi:hypothetical protein
VEEAVSILKKEFKVVSVEEKSGDALKDFKIFILTVIFNEKPLRISVFSQKGTTVLSAVFPKKTFSKEEIQDIKNLLEKALR